MKCTIYNSMLCFSLIGLYNHTLQNVMGSVLPGLHILSDFKRITTTGAQVGMGIAKSALRVHRLKKNKSSN